MYDELIKKLRYCGNAISCLHCPYWEGCGGSKEDLTQAADAIEGLQKRVPPVPHGRLIDADELKDVQQADADFFKGSSDYGEKCRYDEAINAVANIVNAPTIIPAEEGET